MFFNLVKKNNCSFIEINWNAQWRNMFFWAWLKTEVSVFANDLSLSLSLSVYMYVLGLPLMTIFISFPQKYIFLLLYILLIHISMKSFFKAKVKCNRVREASVQITEIKVQYYSVRMTT